VKLTVVISTWNRAKLLDQTLARMRQLHGPSGDSWELLVVNNNCTDDTDAVIAKHSAHLPLRRLYEPKPGKCNAMNFAVDNATGEFLIATDDDVLVNPDWLVAYRAAFRDHPNAGFYGGPVEPWFESSPPRWLSRNWAGFQDVYAVRQLQGGDRAFNPRENPVGANQAFRTELLRTTRYDPKTGRLGAELRGYEEVVVLERLKSAGFVGRWVPGAIVRHFLPASRLTLNYVWDWYRWDGRMKHQLYGHTADSAPTLFGRPRWIFRKYLEARWHAARESFSRGEKWRTAYIEAARLKGVLDWHVGQSRARIRDGEVRENEAPAIAEVG
jgi:glycosyltransferase involved in cell wall biosynthesis